MLPRICLHLMGLIIEINEEARITTKSDFCGGADAGVNPGSLGQEHTAKLHMGCLLV